MARYRALPTMVDAILFDGENHADLVDLGAEFEVASTSGPVRIRSIDTWVTVPVGWYAVRVDNGGAPARPEWYPMPPRLFEQRWEQA